MTATAHPAPHLPAHVRRADVARTADARGPGLAVWLLATFAVLVGTGFAVKAADDGALGRWDLDVVRDLAAHRTSTWDTLSGVPLVFSDTIPVLVAWTLAVVLLAWRTRDWVAPAFISLAVGGEKLIYFVTSTLVDRPRPEVETVGHVYATSSYPSGHVGAAITLWGGLAVWAVWSGHVRGRGGRVALAAAVTLIAVLVGASRVYRGVHHPIDVIAGALLGLSCLAAARWAILAAHPEGTSEGLRASKPSPTNG